MTKDSLSNVMESVGPNTGNARAGIRTLSHISQFFIEGTILRYLHLIREGSRPEAWTQPLGLLLKLRLKPAWTHKPRPRCWYGGPTFSTIPELPVMAEAERQLSCPRALALKHHQHQPTAIDSRPGVHQYWYLDSGSQALQLYQPIRILAHVQTISHVTCQLEPVKHSEALSMYSLLRL